MRTLSVAILLALTAAACHQDDSTFMGVCEQDDGTFVYPVDNQVNATACAMPAPIVWDHVPLTVDLDPELADYSDALNEALLFWNRDLDFVLFRRATPTEAVDVSVVPGSAGDPGLAATSHHRVGSFFALIEYRKPGDITEAQYVFQHELGHVVDLAHDPQGSSVMNATIELQGLDESEAGPDAPDFHFPYVEVTDNDHDALVKLYGP